MSPVTGRVRAWRPRTPLPGHLGGHVTGSIPAERRNGPLLPAADHIGDLDPFLVAAAPSPA